MKTNNKKLAAETWEFLEVWFEAGLRIADRDTERGERNYSILEDLRRGVFFNDKEGDFDRFRNRPISLEEWQTSVGRFALAASYPYFFTTEKQALKYTSMSEFLYDPKSRTSAFTYHLEHQLNVDVRIEYPALTACLLRRFCEYREKFSFYSPFDPSREVIMLFLVGSASIADHLETNEEAINPDYRRNSVISEPKIAKAVWGAFSFKEHQAELVPEDFVDESNLHWIVTPYLTATGVLRKPEVAEKEKDDPAQQEDP